MRILRWFLIFLDRFFPHHFPFPTHLTYIFLTDDAVDFTEDLDDKKEVLSRLKGMVAHVRGRSDSSSSQEDIRVHSKKKSRKTPMTAVHETSKTCSEHEEEELLYWCKEDQVMVCKECLIFGTHRLHTPLKGEEMR